jgi:tRNA(Ile)-lysidine synthase
MLYLAVEAGCDVAVATVDHGLRPEAAAEAEAVAQICAGLGVAHETLRWVWDGTGNLQDAARRGRLMLLSDWARRCGLRTVALGHTEDDIAETFLMRLARDAGVDGLAAMAARREYDGVVFLRPLLGASRADLRAWLLGRGLPWVDDPSNDDARFDRVRARRALAAMAELGAGGAEIASLATKMAQVREALEAATADAAARIVRVDGGDVIVDTAGLGSLPAEIRRRLVLAALMWIGSAEYGPRGAEMDRFVAAALSARPATLAGCKTSHARGRMRLTRELRAVTGMECPADSLWDGRWRVSGPDSNGLTLRALGEEGLAACPDWRAAAHPRATLLASPAVWQGDVLVAAPMAGFGAGWAVHCQPPKGPLGAAPLSH